MECEQQAAGDESAQSEHGGVAEAHLPQVAAHPVPGERGGDEQEGLGEQVLHVDREAQRLGQDGAHRQRREQRDQRGPRDPMRQQLHPSTRWPKRPPGLSTSTRSTKPTAPVRYAGSARMANTSTSARISAAAAVPITLPSPPRTTMTNDLSRSSSSWEGWAA